MLFPAENWILLAGIKFFFKIWFPPERKVYSGRRNVWKMENSMKMENRQQNGAIARM